MTVSRRAPAAPGRSRRIAALSSALSTLVVGAAYACAFAGDRGQRVGAWLMTLGLPGVVVSMMALGLLRRAPARPAERIALTLTFLALAGAYAAGLLLSGDQPVHRVILGFPPAAAAVIYGAGIPLLFLPFVYASSFERERHDAERIRSLRRDTPGAEPPATPDSTPPPGT